MKEGSQTWCCHPSKELGRTRQSTRRHRRSPAPPSEEIWGFLHAVSRLQRCVNWIRWEAERETDLEELLSGARLLPV